MQRKVDDLYRQAGGEPNYAKAKEATAQQKRAVDRALDEAARNADKLNEARRTLGSFAAAQHREGDVTPTGALLLADGPQEHFAQRELTDRPADRRLPAVADFRTRQADAAGERAPATWGPEPLTACQASLQISKESVQQKLATARSLLARLITEERARLAALERKREDEARRKAEAETKAEARALAEAEAERRREEAAKTVSPPPSPPTEASTGVAVRGRTGTGTDSGTGAGTATDSDAGTGTTGTGASSGTSGSTYAAEAAKVLAFARAQIGKPYVWGASGPSSYDCSGLTLAAWKAAGVELPRATASQARIGTRIATDDLLPGDLVFFYDDISHVGIYIGDGMMIHAPRPGTNVREESIYYMPIHGSVRPA